MHTINIIKTFHMDIILGIKFLHAHYLSYCPEKMKLFLGRLFPWNSGHAKSKKVTQLDPLLITFVIDNLVTEGGFLPIPQEKCLVDVATHNHPYLIGGPYWVQPNKQGQVMIPIPKLRSVQTQARNQQICLDSQKH